MIAKVFLLALLVAVASAGPLQDNSMVGYREAIDMFLQAWKKITPCGFADENIPVLAPLTMDFTAFNFTKGDTSLVGNVSDIRISGLNNFQILGGSWNATTLRASFDVIFPEIQILGAYAVEGKLDLFGLALPLRQNVLMNKKISDWRFVGEYTFAQSLNNSKGLRISDFKLQYTVGDVRVDNWDQSLDIAENNFVNKFLASFSLLFSEEIQPYVNAIYGAFVLPSINELLASVDMTQLTNYLVMQAEMWNMAGCNVKA